MSLGSVKIMILPIILVFGVMNERKLDTTPQDFDDPCLTISDTHQYKMSNNIHQWNSSIKFVVFGSARTGSNYLFELLRRHPLIVVYYEIFNQFVEFNYTEPYPNIKISERAIRSRHKDPEKFLNCIWNTNNDNRTAVGFKIFPGHLMNPIVDELLLHDKTIKKMVLIRSDVLAVYASVVFARTSGTWLLSDTSKMNFTLNIADFIVFEKEYVGWYCHVIHTLRHTKQNFVLIEYNNDIANKNHIKKTLHKIQKFIGVPEINLLNSTIPLFMSKQSKTPIAEKILNWNELPQYIKDYSRTNISIVKHIFTRNKNWKVKV